jgi:hypothetical protein
MLCESLQLQLLQHQHPAACAAGCQALLLLLLLAVLLGQLAQQHCQMPVGLAWWQQQQLCRRQHHVLSLLLLLLLTHVGIAPLWLQPLQQHQLRLLLLLLAQLLLVCCHALYQHPALAPAHCLLCWLLCCSALLQCQAAACHPQPPRQPGQHLLRLLHLPQSQGLTLLLLLPLLLLRWPGCWCWTLLGGPCWQG